MNNSQAYAQQLDAQDPLRSFRNEFIIPMINDTEQVYFLGNSLGLQPKRTAAYVDRVMKQWARYGVEAFFMGDDPWLDYHDHLILPLSGIVGALPSELTIMNQLTVNLHLMMVSFYRPSGRRKKIICEAKAFPSDQYMLETHLKHLGLNPEDIIIEVSPREGEYQIRLDDIVSAVENCGDETALVLWGGVNYYTGQVFDMAAITRAAHGVGALAGFDLAHAAGNIELRLHTWNVDFACWCNYKYLNSGPGAMGAAYIHERYHKNPSIPRLAGWWGYEKSTRFRMEKGFIPAASAEGWQLSTPSPILYATHRASLEIFAEAGFERLLQKGQQMSSYLLFLLNELQDRTGTRMMEILTPGNTHEKGCQVSMLIPVNGRKIFDHLTDAGFFADWREPDVIRVAPVPLYNRYEEIWKFVSVIETALAALPDNQ